MSCSTWKCQNSMHCYLSRSQNVDVLLHTRYCLCVLKEHFIDLTGMFRIVCVVVHLLRSFSFHIYVLMVKGKGKVHPRTGHEGLGGEQKYGSTHSLIQALDGGVVKATPRPLYPRERDRVPIVQVAGWAPGRSGRVRKILLSPGFDPRTIQLVSSPYSDYAIPFPLCFNDAINLQIAVFEMYSVLLLICDYLVEIAESY